MRQLTISLEENTGSPLYAQIYEHIRGEIKAGEIPAYSRLPSTRKLSQTLGVSRSTVQLAYDQLLAEGYLDAEPCRGYYVAEMEGALPFHKEETAREGESLASDTSGRAAPGFEKMKGDGGELPEREPAWVCDFSPAGVDLSCFPYKTWRRLTRDVFSDESGAILHKGMTQGEPALRQALCEYLHGARGVRCRPEQIVVGAGNEYLLMLLSQVFERPFCVAMEDPTYYQAYRVLTALGHEIYPVALDAQGMRADLLERQEARLAYVMPSHQYPTGIVMPIARRLELLSWASRKDGYLIEDDYDSEFRYRGRPIPALQSVDREARVIYLGTFSRAVAPAIRVSYMVLPEELLARYRERCGFYACTVPRADQEVLARFLEGGSFERHLNRMRGVYREKKDRLLELLKPLESEFRIQGDEAGVHILITSRRFTEEELIRRAAGEGVRVYGLSRHYIEKKAAGASRTVLAGFARLGPEEMERGAKGLLKAWKTEAAGTDGRERI